MPTYDYRCSSCGARLEIVHSIHGGPPETCPSCGAKDTLRKAFAPPAIVFKGTGWAKKERTSSARSSGSKAGDESAKAESGSSSDGTSSAGSSTTSGTSSSSSSGSKGGGSAKTETTGA